MKYRCIDDKIEMENRSPCLTLLIVILGVGGWQSRTCVWRRLTHILLLLLPVAFPSCFFWLFSLFLFLLLVILSLGIYTFAPLVDKVIYPAPQHPPPRHRLSFSLGCTIYLPVPPKPGLFRSPDVQRIHLHSLLLFHLHVYIYNTYTYIFLHVYLLLT